MVWMVVANVRRGRRAFTRMLDAAEVVFVIVVIHCGSSAWITRDCIEGGGVEEGRPRPSHMRAGR